MTASSAFLGDQCANGVPLIVGSRQDVHVESVLFELEQRGVRPEVVDVSSLAAKGFAVDLDGLEVSTGGHPTCGWLRRSAPDDWMIGVAGGSVEDAKRRSFLRLVASLCRLGATAWLTTIEAMIRAEDRLLQLSVARALGFTVPETIVTSDPGALTRRFGDRFVVKPLGRGFYIDGKSYAVYASEIASKDLGDIDLGAAPFVAQARLDVRSHWRVVTVRDAAWCAHLDAHGWPLDWREADGAHASWQAADHPALGAAATKLAAELQVGYSSQDWVLVHGGEDLVFLDLNPAGQWLFLPDPIAIGVTRAISRFLMSASVVSE